MKILNPVRIWEISANDTSEYFIHGFLYFQHHLFITGILQLGSIQVFPSFLIILHSLYPLFIYFSFFLPPLSLPSSFIHSLYPLFTYFSFLLPPLSLPSSPLGDLWR